MEQSQSQGAVPPPGGEPECVICHRPLTGKIRTLGGRSYCQKHYLRVTMGSHGPWEAMGVKVLGLVVLALIMLGIGDNISDELGDDWIVLIGLVLAIVPAVLWLGVVRPLDRLEPEPNSFLLSTLALGALIAGTIGEPLRRDLLHLNTWRPDSWFYAILVQSLTQGVIQALTVFVAVRFTVYLTDEFDERADGVVYGTAAGLGIATLLNFNYVLDHRGLNLDVGTTRIIVNALAQAALGGIVGYGLGQVKFEKHAPWFAALFVAAAALLNGCYDWLQSEATTSELGFEAWRGVIVAGLFAAAVFGVVFYLLRSAIAETLSRAGRPSHVPAGEQ